MVVSAERSRPAQRPQRRPGRAGRRQRVHYRHSPGRRQRRRAFERQPPRQKDLRRARRRQDPQSRHHRPHRSRQDHADRQHLPRRPRVPRERACRRARDGQQRPRARARHHHPLQALHGGVEGLPHQHHRHARPRRFQRRGRARAQHGRLGAAARRRQRGPDAADALRAHAGAGVRAAPDRHRQQGRPAERRPLGRSRQDLRPLRRAGREQRAARLPRALRLGPRRLDRQRPGRVPEGRARARGAPAPTAGRSRRRCSRSWPTPP